MVDEYKELSEEEKKIKFYWGEILKRLKTLGSWELAYVWTEEVREYFARVSNEGRRIIKILRRLRSYYSINAHMFGKSISDIDNLRLHLRKISSKERWIKLIHDDLKTALRDIEVILGRIKHRLKEHIELI